jgi:Na+-transporting methylmalonyl-CoA/oxaloacetate decarboxylase gamma subunit
MMMGMSTPSVVMLLVLILLIVVGVGLAAVMWRATAATPSREKPKQKSKAKRHFAQPIPLPEEDGGEAESIESRPGPADDPYEDWIEWAAEDKQDQNEGLV